ncbi:MULTISPECIES: hypothetical protein [Mycolicibacterium]|uniref:Transcriptional regulator n=2 Tax=Mycolicibacterium TaxID=1866885 RepID=A0ABQ0KTG2_MYCNV|nr:MULTISPECIES: hypothetical protein [Mycolicibacterium]GAT12860.1 transcriptional regulator [Mycolicibacterium novocastrense]STZ41507.1 transcriptional regulator [Mycolicibacterium gilvum]
MPVRGPYGHFPTRADLVDAVFVRTLAEAQQTLDTVDLTWLPPSGTLLGW